MDLCTVHGKDGSSLEIFLLSIPLPCLASHCIALHYIALQCIAFHCIALHSTALHYITLHFTAFIAFPRIALLSTALHCFPLRCIAGTNSVSSPPAWSFVWKEKFNILNNTLFCSDKSLLWASVNRKILICKDQITNYVGK